MIIACPGCRRELQVSAPTTTVGFAKCPACDHVMVVPPAGISRRPITDQEAADVPLAELLTAECSDEDELTALGTVAGAAPEIAGVAAPARGRLVLPDGRRVELSRFQTTMGRRNADVPLDDPDVSRQHAVIERHDDKYLLKDLGSTNGTFLNEQRVTIDFLTHGDLVRVGRTVLRFELS